MDISWCSWNWQRCTHLYKVKQEAEISYRAAFTQPGVCLIPYRSLLPNVRLVSCLVLFYGDEELLHPSSLIRPSLSSPHFTLSLLITNSTLTFLARYFFAPMPRNVIETARKCQKKAACHLQRGCGKYAPNQ